MNYRDLEAVRQIVNDATGLEITYAYEDLVFPENGAFIIQFDDTDNNLLYCHFHRDCKKADQETIFDNLAEECEQRKCILEESDSYTLEQVGEEIQIRFVN